MGAHYSVYERRDSPFWWIAFGLGDGRTCVSSKIPRTDPLGYKRALDLARTQAENAKARRDHAGAWNWVGGWLELKFASSPRTLAAEAHRWRFVEAFVREHGLSPATITYQHGLEFLAWRQRHRTRSGKGSFNNALQELKLFGRVLREGVRRGFLHASPLERMGLKRDRPAQKPEITDDEVRIIRAALHKKEGDLPWRERWMTVSFEIALHQGCRLSETAVPLSAINEREGTIYFVQKGQRPHLTALHDGLRPIIAALRGDGAKVTCTLPKMAAKHWHWFFKGRKERHQPAIAPRLCFHCTRVTAITRLARAGVPIQQAMRFVGHADSTIHAIYQRLQPPDLARCTAALQFPPA